MSSEYEELLSLEELENLEQEFCRIKGSVYLDHSGATLYSKSQLDQIHSELQSTLYSNPHSRNPSSSITTDAIDHIRARILAHFCTSSEDYSVIFTSGATSALKIVAESFNFNGGFFAYLEESHNSAVGMREIVRNSGGDKNEPLKPRIICLSKRAMEELMNSKSHKDFQNFGVPPGPGAEQKPERVKSTPWSNCENNSVNNLLVYPAQCNFSGFKFPLNWITFLQNDDCGLNPLCQIQTPFTYINKYYHKDLPDNNKTNGTCNGNEKMGSKKTSTTCTSRTFTMLDAASFAATSPLDLSKFPADFVCLSFYKIFGYPTGLGALLVRNSSSHVLSNKKYFGGGTVNIAIPSSNFHVKRSKLHERFEDGTIPFLSILGVGHGFDILNKLSRNFETISERTFRLAAYFYRGLSGLRYGNGQPVALIYSDTEYTTRETQGPIVTFNLLRHDGNIIGYSEMEQIAYLNDLHLRYGCFCNPGACRRHLGLESEEILKHYEAGHVCGDMNDIVDGKPTGAIRVSVGYMTRKSDLDFLLNLIYNCWIKPQTTVTPQFIVGNGDLKHEKSELSVVVPRDLKLLRIFIYPLKSCGAFEVSSTWPISSGGMLYDRQWLIVNSAGVPITVKREPRLTQLKPRIDISNRRLILSMKGFPDGQIPLELGKLGSSSVMERKAELCSSKVCGDQVFGLDCGQEVSDWLSHVFQTPGLKLIRMDSENQRKPKKKRSADEISLSMANYSQFLLLTMASLTRLARDLMDRGVNSSFNYDYDEEKPQENGQKHHHEHEEKEPLQTSQNVNKSSSNKSNFELKNSRDFDENRKNVQHLDSAAVDLKLKGKKDLETIIESLIGRFRANFVIGGNVYPSGDFEEESWLQLQIGHVSFKSGGPCQRCATICTDPKTSMRSPEPYLTLSSSRGGKANFGIHLFSTSTKTQSSTKGSSIQLIHIGDSIKIKIDQPKPKHLENPQNTWQDSGNKLKSQKIIENID